MAKLPKNKELKKELTLANVYAIATGTTLSGGFFLLPGIAANMAGAALIISYLLAAIPMIPAMFCLMELATAMPRSGGAYYFLDRSMGPMIGTIGGIGTWLSLVFKVAFGLIGMGAYLSLFIEGDFIIPIAVVCAIIFGIVNVVGAKESGFIQTLLVWGILILLTGFIGIGLFHTNASHFTQFWGSGVQSIFATAGLVYISFAGITKVTSVSEEVKDPERNLPLGMFLAFATAMLVYGLGMYVLVGVIPPEQLRGNLTPVATAAEIILGPAGKILVTIAAFFAFSSVTNAGILSASRYPMAMSRDHLIPKVFRNLNKENIPVISVLFTVATILFLIVAMNPAKIAKLASSFQLIVFAFCCFAVIIMRESHIEAYDPGYHAPLYPWIPILGIVLPFFLIIEMGTIAILFSFGMIVFGSIWYFWYARGRVAREGAILHVFQRLGQYRHEGLEVELRGIMKEKGLREHDPFEEIITQSHVMDLSTRKRFDEIILEASKILSERVSYPAEKIAEEIMAGTKVGGTPVSHGVALPHMRLHHIIEPEILIVRAKKGVDIDLGEEFWGEHKPDDDQIRALFFLISPEENPKQHLRILAKIAGRVDDASFMQQWLEANDDQEIKEVLLRDESFMILKIRTKSKSENLIGKALKDLLLPEQTLIALINRDGQTLVPRGNTVLKEADRLTVIGNQKGITEFRRRFG